MDQSPLSTPDGSLLLGSQHTSVFLLDGRTGQLLRQGLPEGSTGWPALLPLLGRAGQVPSRGTCPAVASAACLCGRLLAHRQCSMAMKVLTVITRGGGPI